MSVVDNDDLTLESSGGNKPPCHGTWSDADKERFIEELLLRRKDLRGVARAVGRPVKEVVAFYYSPLTCHAIASHRWFDRVIIALIVASSVCLAIDSP